VHCRHGAGVAEDNGVVAARQRVRLPDRTIGSRRSAIWDMVRSAFPGLTATSPRSATERRPTTLRLLRGVVRAEGYGGRADRLGAEARSRAIGVPVSKGMPSTCDVDVLRVLDERAPAERADARVTRSDERVGGLVARAVLVGHERDGTKVDGWVGVDAPTPAGVALGRFGVRDELGRARLRQPASSAG
jgi:hypothetical protein